MKKLLGVLLAVMLISCGSAESGHNCKNSSIKRELAYPAELQYLNENGMKYMVFTAYSGGVSVVNVTLDSLKSEYYRRELNKK